MKTSSIFEQLNMKLITNPPLYQRLRICCLFALYLLLMLCHTSYPTTNEDFPTPPSHFHSHLCCIYTEANINNYNGVPFPSMIPFFTAAVSTWKYWKGTSIWPVTHALPRVIDAMAFSRTQQWDINSADNVFDNSVQEER